MYNSNIYTGLKMTFIRIYFDNELDIGMTIKIKKHITLCEHLHVSSKTLVFMKHNISRFCKNI